MALAALALPIVAVALFAFAVSYTSHYRASGELSFWEQVAQNIPVLGPLATLLGMGVGFFSRTITDWAGKAATQIDAPVGAAFHEIAGTIRDAGDVINRLGLLAVSLVQRLAGVATHHEVTSSTNTLRRELHATAAQAETALRHSIAAEESALRSVAQGVYPRLRSLEHQVDRTLPREIRRTHSLAREAADKATAAFKKAKAIPFPAQATTWAAAVALALPALGLGWLRCGNVRSVGRALCGIPGALLSDLLGLLADFLILTNICELIPLLETAASDIGTPLVELLTDAGAGLCAAGSSAPAALTGPSFGTIPVYLQ